MKNNNFLAQIKNIKNDKRKMAIILLIVFISLAVFIFLFAAEKKEAKIDGDESNYVSELESRLSATLSKIDGAGKVSVMITVESGKETVLASKTSITESNGKILREETPIIVNGKTVVIKENFPKIIGVLIVAEGANNISVLSKIQQATMSVLDVDLKRVEILSMK